MSNSHMWCVGQREAYTQLKLFSDLLFHRKWKSSFLSPRLIPLIVGPTGVGKSHVVRTLAHDLGLPFLRLTSSNWIVSGSRDLTTVSRVHQFVSTHKCGIIQVDELDKFQQSPTSDWCRNVIGEVFDLLDGTILRDPELSKKLRTKVLLVGTGTWQDLWPRKSWGIGFKTRESHESFEGIEPKIRDSTVIPLELLRRFNANLIVIPPADENDYRNSAHNIGLVELAASLGYQLDYGEAVRSGCGSRWLEEQFTQLLLLAIQNGREDLVPVVSAQFEELDPDMPF